MCWHPYTIYVVGVAQRLGLLFREASNCCSETSDACDCSCQLSFRLGIAYVDKKALMYLLRGVGTACNVLKTYV